VEPTVPRKAAVVSKIIGGQHREETYMNKRDYQQGDILRLTDTRVVRFVERGGSDKDVLIVSDRNDVKDIIREDKVVGHYRPEQNKAYGAK
jgi:hypothetical protein